MIIIRCEICGSSEISRDANANWDVKTQSWVLGSVYDDGYCHKCTEERTLIECAYVEESA